MLHKNKRSERTTLAKIGKTIEVSKCKLCGERDETIDHVTSGCNKLAQNDYKKGNINVAAMLHCNLCKKYYRPTSRDWWNHKNEKFIENVKLLWNFEIHTYRHIICQTS